MRLAALRGAVTGTSRDRGPTYPRACCARHNMHTFSVRSRGRGNPYVDGPLFARAEQRADRIDCDHMSGLLMAVHMTACQDGGPRREFQTVLRLRVVPLGSTECLASGID
jgi:hypothetical protein